jgi:hypothetical protein
MIATCLHLLLGRGTRAPRRRAGYDEASAGPTPAATPWQETNRSR